MNERTIAYKTYRKARFEDGEEYYDERITPISMSEVEELFGRDFLLKLYRRTLEDNKLLIYPRPSEPSEKKCDQCIPYDDGYDSDYWEHPISIENLSIMEVGDNSHRYQNPDYKYENQASHWISVCYTNGTPHEVSYWATYGVCVETGYVSLWAN